MFLSSSLHGRHFTTCPSRQQDFSLVTGLVDLYISLFYYVGQWINIIINLWKVIRTRLYNKSQPLIRDTLDSPAAPVRMRLLITSHSDLQQISFKDTKSHFNFNWIKHTEHFITFVTNDFLAFSVYFTFVSLNFNTTQKCYVCFNMLLNYVGEIFWSWFSNQIQNITWQTTKCFIH